MSLRSYEIRTGSSTTRVQREHRLDGDIHGRHIEGLEHDLGHALTVGLGVERRLGEQHGVLLGRHTQLIVERVVPDLLHVIPVAHNPVLDRVLQCQNAPFRLGLVANVCVLLAHAHHHTRVPWPPHNGREDSTRGIIPSKPSLK